MTIRERIDAFPTHRWVARAVFPVFILQRTTHVVSNDLFDSLMLGYLWWVSELALDESWHTRRLQEEAEVAAPGRVNVSYDMPPAIVVDMDPAPPLTPPGPPPVGLVVDDEEEQWRGGLYL